VQPVMVRRKRTGRMVALPAGLEVELAPLAQQYGIDDRLRLARVVAAENHLRQEGVVQHGQAVLATCSRSWEYRRPSWHGCCCGAQSFSAGRQLSVRSSRLNS
jgi:hypothetical protein